MATKTPEMENQVNLLRSTGRAKETEPEESQMRARSKPDQSQVRARSEPDQS
jgi:hypothetical protein